MSTSSVLSVVCAGVLAVGVSFIAARADAPANPPATKPAEAMAEGKVDAKQAFAAIKTLAGKWKEVDGDSRLEFKVSSNGSVVVETMLPGTPMEMTNVYHLDGDRLLVTHYCGSGNQPRMQLTKADGGKLTFGFLDITNQKRPDSMRMDGLVIDIKSADEASEVWTSSQAGKADEHMTIAIKRES